MTPVVAARIAALFGFLAVALGAFGAHGLSERLNQFHTTAIWEKAVLYHFIHALMLFVLSRAPFHPGPWFCFLLGILIFSGSLYVLAAFNIRWLGAVTPIGGVGFLAGWLWLMIAPLQETVRNAP
jgi:uncharacterized membrane protein YgdD (TMEM256/DUF423 family)